jgi:hypothetical protein
MRLIFKKKNKSKDTLFIVLLVNFLNKQHENEKYQFVDYDSFN